MRLTTDLDNTLRRLVEVPVTTNLRVPDLASRIAPE
jgi:hypothetical protein